MLSVNIPVYNTEVNELVGQLAGQVSKMNIDFEIRVYDDCSNQETKAKNQSLTELNNVVYKEMPANLGRSAIRNKLGTESEHDYLLFIDADSKLVSDTYIEEYVKRAIPGCVLCGGTAYAAEKPAEGKKLLRWVYGHKREAIPAQKRNKSKGFILTSNNFLIDKQVFQRTLFRENIGPYGHEDTLLGYDLYKQGIHPLHINNPVEHRGLEDSEVFIAKTRKALENLLVISEDLLNGASDFIQKVRFLQHYHNTTKVFPPVLLRLFYRVFKKNIEKHLAGENPALIWFDLYKVGYFAKLKRGKK